MTPELLHKYFQGTLPESEKHLVMEYILRHPEVMDKYLTEENWNSFDSKNALDPQISERMKLFIRKRTSDKSFALKRNIKWLAAAAVLFIVCNIAVLLMRNPDGKKVISQVAVKPSLQVPKELVQNNTTRKPLKIELNDGSRVELATASEIRYDSAFNKRDIYLKGSALFRVAKNPQRPFTVYTEKLATTALGTVFRVTDNIKGHVFVHLFEGRVVVHSDSSKQTSGVNETFLNPGELLDFNQRSLAVSVKKNAGQKHPSLKPRIKEVLHFSNQPLTDILRIIKDKRSLNVMYAEGVIDGMNFTGTWDENKESLTDFLGTVCLLNNLELIRENGNMRIIPKAGEVQQNDADQNGIKKN